VGRIGGVEKFEEFDEFASAMPVTRSMPASKLTVPRRLYSPFSIRLRRRNRAEKGRDEDFVPARSPQRKNNYAGLAGVFFKER
jgi:hypothetical protein